MKSFGMGRNLIPSEMELLKKWTGRYGFSKEIIAEACKRTIQNIHEPSFEYTDSILGRWHQSNVHTLEDIRQRMPIISGTKSKTSAAQTGTDQNFRKS